MAEHLRTNPGVSDIYAAVVEIGNIARRELGPSHLGNGRDLRIAWLIGLPSKRR